MSWSHVKMLFRFLFPEDGRPPRELGTEAARPSRPPRRPAVALRDASVPPEAPTEYWAGWPYRAREERPVRYRNRDWGERRRRVDVTLTRRPQE